jgi:hypothetical protein
VCKIKGSTVLAPLGQQGEMNLDLFERVQTVPSRGVPRVDLQKGR